jgi:hypothetical protein
MVLALAWSVVGSVPAMATTVFIDEPIEGVSPTVTSDFAVVCSSNGNASSHP